MSRSDQLLPISESKTLPVMDGPNATRLSPGGWSTEIDQLLTSTRVARRTLDLEALGACDCAVIITDHRAFDYEFIADHCHNVVDTRNALQGRVGSHLVRLGAPMESRSLSTQAA